MLTETNHPLGSDLEVSIHETTTGVLVHLEGEATYATVEQMDATLSEILERQPAVVAFDLRGLRSISMVVLGSLVLFQRGMRRFGGDVFLANVSPVVGRTLQLSQALEALPVRDDLVSA